MTDKLNEGQSPTHPETSDNVEAPSSLTESEDAQDTDSPSSRFSIQPKDFDVLRQKEMAIGVDPDAPVKKEETGSHKREFDAPPKNPPSPQESYHDNSAENDSSDGTKDDSPTLTRFGMLPPKLSDTDVKGSASGRRFQPTGSSTGGKSVDLDYTESYSHAPKRPFGARFKENLYALMIFLLKAGAFTLALLLVLGAFAFAFLLYNGGISYFLDGGSQEPQVVTGNDDPKPVAPTAPQQVPFFSLLAQGKSFLYLIDASERMSDQSGYNTWNLIKAPIFKSFDSLKNDQDYEVVYFNERITTSSFAEHLGELKPATITNIVSTQDSFNSLFPSGKCELLKAFQAVQACQVEVIFLVCDSLNATEEQLDELTVNDLARGLENHRLFLVEIGDGRRPLTRTPLEILAQSIKGSRYQWCDRETLRANSYGDLQFRASINSDSLSLVSMINTDFDERFTGDLSTEFSRQGSPFGKESFDKTQWSDASERSRLLTPPRMLSLSQTKVLQITSDARLVYLSGFQSDPWRPSLLHLGAESRLALWVEGAKAELPAAEYLIGLCYKNDVRITPSSANALKAVLCQKKAAQGGCLPAMYLFADSHLKQQGEVAPNPSAAKQWFEKAANLGEPFSQLYLANRYHTADPKEKAVWLGKAAELGLPEAQYQLGKCYENGSGVQRNRDLALRYYRLAAKQKHEEAAAAAKELEKQ